MKQGVSTGAIGYRFAGGVGSSVLDGDGSTGNHGARRINHGSGERRESLAEHGGGQQQRRDQKNKTLVHKEDLFPPKNFADTVSRDLRVNALRLQVRPYWRLSLHLRAREPPEIGIYRRYYILRELDPRTRSIGGV